MCVVFVIVVKTAGGGLWGGGGGVRRFPTGETTRFTILITYLRRCLGVLGGPVPNMPYGFCGHHLFTYWCGRGGGGGAVILLQGKQLVSIF